MLMPDVNVLVYAHRSELDHHGWYRGWLEDAMNGPTPLAFSTSSLMGFVRVVTNRRAFAVPTPLPIATGVVDALVGHPRSRVVGPGPRHWALARDLCLATNATGKLVADAAHAAIAIEAGCTWVSRDRDFARFEQRGLRWQHLSP